MKKTIQLITLFCVVLIQSVSAQVTIPDANFRARLQYHFPSCFNGDILDTLCAANALNVIQPNGSKKLYVNSGQISSIEGIKYFKKIEDIRCDDNLLTSLPELPKNVKHFDCSNNLITNLSSIPSQLKTFSISYNQLTNLPPIPNRLQQLFCDHNQLTSLPTFTDSLWVIVARNNQLTSFPAITRWLQYVDCGYNQLTSFPSIPVEHNMLTLAVEHNQITSLSIDNAWGLAGLYCGNNPLISLPNVVPSDQLVCDSIPNLSCLPFLPSTLVELDVTGTNINCLPNKPVGLTSSLPLCNPTNNTNACRVFPRITGYVFHDNNNNGVKDAGEMPRVGVPVTVSSVDAIAYTNNQGFYDIAINVDLQNDTIGTFVVEVDVPTYYTTPAETQSATFTAYGETVERNFPLQTTQTVKDLRVHLTNLNAFARPGFGLNLHLGYQNKGTVPANAVIKFAKADLYNVASSSIAHTLSGDTLVWTIPNVQVGQFGYIQIQGTLSASAPLGSIQNFYAAVNQNDATDNMIADNSSLLQMQVRGSYDPNDKQGPATITPTQVANGKFIDYTIRFQNTGTDTAFNVVVTDTLANNLQANTLEIVSASHNMMTELKGNIIYFKFNNILLPDSNVSEPRSHGFVSFRIKPKTNLTLGNTIQNKAAIYFDFNAPVITNTVTTTVAIPTGITEKVSRRLEVYPNPLEGEILTVPNMRGASAKLLSLEGKELRTWSNIGEQISLQNIASGMYLLEVLHEGQRRVAKVVVK